MKVKLRRLVSLVVFISLCDSSWGQIAIPDRLPDLKYPPIARAAHVEGDVVIRFRITADGLTDDVSAVSGPVMLREVATGNVKAWHFNESVSDNNLLRMATFHFALQPPADGYDEGQAVTKVEISGEGDVRVLSAITTGLNRSECPSAAEQVPAPSVIDGDYVELHRWNEVVRVNADGSVAWREREDDTALRRGYIEPSEATALLERFRTTTFWGLCGSYDQAGLMDGGSSSIRVRIGRREKTVGEYGDAAPPIFRDVEDAVDASAKTHQWRHGDPPGESIIEIAYEFLPKPGKTKLMDAILTGDKARIQGAFATGDQITDADASGWTPLMYAAGSYSSSGEEELLKAGADVNARSKRGETALMAAASRGMTDEELIHAGADVNASNDKGTTALMLLSQLGKPDEIATMLRAGADARKKDVVGRAALDYLYAANCGRPIIAKKDPPGIMEEVPTYKKCDALRADYFKSKQVLIDAGVRAKQVSVTGKTK